MQAPSVAALPQLEQRRRQQRQRPRLALDVGDQSIDELLLHAQTGTARGQLDRAAQLVAAHRPHQNVAGVQQQRQLGIGGAAPVEVGAHGHQHDRRPPLIASAADQRVDERAALGLVAAQREDLLELIHRDDQPLLGRGRRDRPLERPQRMLARTQQRDWPALAAQQHPASERGE
jgi:hypothetical protein